MTDRETPGTGATSVTALDAQAAVEAVSAAKAEDPRESSDELDGRLADHFVSLADSLFAASADGVLAVVERVVRTAGVLVPGADVVSVALREPDEMLATVWSNDETAELADRLQNEVGEGPSLSVADRHGVGAVMTQDLDAGDDWPAFASRASSELGLRAALSTGMFPGGDPPRFGALNFYSRTPKAFDDSARDCALILAAHAATAISAVQARTAGELREAQLAEALRSRDVIGQAKGILMERRGQTADEAFAVLQRASQDLNIKLRDVAQTLVSHRDVI